MSVIRKIVLNQLRRRNCSVVLLANRSYSDRSDECIKSHYGDLEIPRMHLVEYCFQYFKTFSDRTAVQCGVTNRRYTFDDLMVNSEKFGKGLRKVLGLEKGSVVALLLPNVPEFYVCAFGCMLAGLKITTINPAYTPDEIKRQLVDSDAKAVMTLVQLWENAKTAVDLTKQKTHVITVKNVQSESTPIGAFDFHEILNLKTDLPDLELPSPDETVFIPYSSGTTGLPKGVELRSRNVVANVSQVTHPEFKMVAPGSTPQDIMIAVLPLFHVYGFTTTLALLVDGTKIITVPKFTPESYIGSLRDHHPTILMLVPPMVIFLYSHPGVKAEYFSSLRVVTSGAAPLGALDEEKLRQKVVKPVNVLQGYGLSETSPAVVLVPLKLQGKYPGSMGTALPNTLLKIVAPDDQTGQHLGCNVTGELWVKGPQVMKGYLNKPEETANCFHQDWFKTGDLVRCDEHGMVYIADRIKELIKVKGFQVPPAELEEIIRDFPGVAEAAVIGVPHETHGEAPRAYVIPKQNAKVDIKKLDEHVSLKVAKHKRLTGGIAVVNSIPKTPSGKLLRKELKEKYEKTGV